MHFGKSWLAVSRLSDSTAQHARHNKCDSHDTCSGALPQLGLGWTCLSHFFLEVVPDNEIDANPEHKRINLYTWALLFHRHLPCWNKHGTTHDKCNMLITSHTTSTTWHAMLVLLWRVVTWCNMYNLGLSSHECTIRSYPWVWQNSTFSVCIGVVLVVWWNIEQYQKQVPADSTASGSISFMGVNHSDLIHWNVRWDCWTVCMYSAMSVESNYRLPQTEPLYGLHTDVHWCTYTVNMA